jgi:hypothetical protein
MTLDQFVATHTGKYLDYDGHFGAQCVDLIDFYLVQVLGIPIAWANAVDWYGKDAAFERWTRNIWGNPTSRPSRGSIVVWGANARAGTGIYGHIAICTDPGNGLSFTSFDQNWPAGSPCHLVKHTYDGVIGWGDRLVPPPPIVVPVPVPPVVDPCADLRVQLSAAEVAQLASAARVAAYQSWLAGAPK